MKKRTRPLSTRRLEAMSEREYGRYRKGLRQGSYENIARSMAAGSAYTMSPARAKRFARLYMGLDGAGANRVAALYRKYRKTKVRGSR
jgi:hypothetical protein